MRFLKYDTMLVSWDESDNIWTMYDYNIWNKKSTMREMDNLDIFDMGETGAYIPKDGARFYEALKYNGFKEVQSGRPEER